MPERTDDHRDDHVPDDDELAARIRGALDSRAAPVTLDEVVGEPDRSTGTTAAVVVDVEAAGDEQAVAHEVTPLGPRRRRAPVAVVAAAAAAIVVLVAAAVLVSRDPTDRVDAGDPTTTTPAPGASIFDPAAGVLQDRQVSALAAGDGLLYLAYERSSAGGSNGTVPAAPDGGVAAEQALELERQADAVGEEIESIEAEIADDPMAPANEPRLQEAAGLRTRQTELRLQASEARLRSRATISANGLLVAHATTGEVIADHPLPGRVEDGNLLTDGDDVVLLASTASPTDGTGPAVTVLRARGSEPPSVVTAFPDAPVSIAIDGDEAWFRRTDQVGRIGLTPGADSGAVSDVWRGPGVIANGDGGTWATAGTDVVARVETEVPPGVDPGRAVTVTQYDDPADRRLLVAGGSVLVVDSSRAVRIGADRFIGPQPYRADATITGASAGGGRFWLANEGPDPLTESIEVTVIDGATGESRSTSIPIVGLAPIVAALDDGGAVVCVTGVRSPDGPDGTPRFGSDCRRVASSLDAVEPVPGDPDPTASTSVTPPAPVTPSTDPPPTSVPGSPTLVVPSSTTSVPGSRPFAADGISVAGLDPIRLGMTADELTAATGLATVAIEPVCGPNGRAVIGLPDGVDVVFNGDDTVRAIVIRSSAFATADGLSVDSTVAELRAAHPDAVAYDHLTAMQYVVVAPDRSSGIFFAAEGDDITVIDVAQGTQDFLDLC